MPVSSYLRSIRELVGPRLLLLPAVAAVVRDGHGRVLVMRDAASGGWSLPAGGVEPGESPEQAVRREVAEETGLRVAESRLVGAVGGAGYRTTYPNGDRVEYTVCVYACAVEGGAPEAVDGEAAAFEWLAPEAVPARLDLPYPPELFAAP